MIRYLLATVLIGLAVLALIFYPAIESAATTILGQPAPPSLGQDQGIWSWGYSPAAVTTVLVAMFLLGLVTVFFSMYVTMYDYQLQRGVRPQEGARHALFTMTMLLLLWPAAFCLFVLHTTPLGLAIGICLALCSLCASMGLCISTRTH